MIYSPITVIAFSGPGNTGKTTAIQSCKEKYESQGLSVFVFDEIARRDFDPNDSFFDIQIKVLEGEEDRQEVLAGLIDDSCYDMALVDRPWRDGMVYVEWNRKLGNISDVEYDHLMSAYLALEESYGCQYDYIISRSQPLKHSKNKKFLHYNSSSLNRLLTIETKIKSSCPVVYGRNGKDDNVISVIDDIIKNQ